LHKAQEQNWIPTILTWLNLHDRPAVQVEALLALTNIAELCAQQSYFQTTAPPPHSSSSSAVAAAAAVSAMNDAVEKANKQLTAAGAGSTSSSVPANLISPAPGSVPFPPLSFSQTLSPEAVAAFDASLTSTIAGSLSSAATTVAANAAASNIPPAPLFQPTGGGLKGDPAASANAINFTSLAPPPGGAHTSVPSNHFLPPPTPVTAPHFPQQLSASSQHLLLRHADAIPTLISLLSSPNSEVYEQAVWILGSIAAGDSPGSSAAAAAAAAAASGGAGAGGTGKDGVANADNKSVSARDVILAAGSMTQLLRCLEAHPTNLSLQRIGSWTLSNLVDGIFQQPSSTASSHSGKGGGAGKSNKDKENNNDYTSSDEIHMDQLLPVLRRLLRSSDSEVLGYTCWTLSHLCDGPSSHIAAVVTTPSGSSEPKGGLVPRLVELLLHDSWRVTKPALRTIGNIVCAECSDDNAGSGGNTGSGSSSTDYTEVILECNAVPRLKELVTHSNREIQKESCWTLSNIAAGTVDQIQAVIDSGAIPPLVDLVRDKKTDSEVRSEACWVVLNATSCGSDSQIEVLVDEGCVSVLGVLLSEASMVMMALEGLERVLQVEETRELARREKQLREGDGSKKKSEDQEVPTLVSASLIEKARSPHNSSAVIKRADRIWKQHFVSCALCKKSFSKHKPSDASFCEECKCHVCSNCNCKIYHLDYQEELWAATEEKSEAKKNAKKSKNKKKKAKLKNRKAAKQGGGDDIGNDVEFSPDSSNNKGQQQGNHGSMVSESSDVPDKKKDDANNSSSSSIRNMNIKNEEDPAAKTSPSPSFDDDDDLEQNIDFVLYLQQTGSIISLAKLMDALEEGGEDYDEELNDYERKIIREQQTMREQQQQQQAH